MPTGISQIFTLTGTKGISARVTVNETYDIAANTSDISVGVEILSSSYYGHIYYLNGTVIANGETLETMSSFAGTHFVYVSGQNTWHAVQGGDGYQSSPWTLSGIAHNVDGSKTITVSISLGGEETSGNGADGWKVSGSLTVTLTHIPRASTIGATDAAIGAVSMLAVSRKSSNYTHSIAYTFGSLSGYITADGGTSSAEVKLSDTNVAFAVPASFYAQISNAKSGTCSLTCRTYSGSTQIGDAQMTTFTVTASEAVCAPSVSGTVVDSNSITVALTGDSSKLVRYYSTALCTINATAKNSASIVSKSIGGVAVTDTTRSIENVESGSITFAATDSRGYSNSAIVEAPLVSYVRLTCNPVGKRTDPTSGNATLTISGEYYNGSFGAAANTLTLRYRLNSGSWVTVTPTISDNSYSATVSLTGLDYTATHTISVEVVDKLSTVTKTIKIGKGIPVFDWGENDVTFHVPVNLQGGAYGADGAGFAPAGYITKLWENASPGSETFPAQKVYVNTTGYDFVFVEAKMYATNPYYMVSSWVPAVSGCHGMIFDSGPDLWIHIRQFTVYSDGITFSAGAQHNPKEGFYATEGWDNRAIPLAIYGVKGVQ